MTPPFLARAHRTAPARCRTCSARRGARGARTWPIDHKPPRTFGEERAMLCALLQYQRDCVVRKIAGLGEEDARWSPVPSGTSLLWLLRHLGRAEAIWVLHRFAGLDVDRDLLDDRLLPADTVARLLARYRHVWSLVDATIASSDLDAICVREDEEANPDLRWVLVHLVEETARHA